MTSLERAKKFISHKSRVIAASIIPLAAVTLPAPSSATVTGFSTGSCVIGGTNASVGSGGCIEQSDGLDSTSGLVGVKILDSSQIDPVVTASFAGGSGGFSLNLNASGLANGTNNYTGTIPVYWNFTPSDTNGGQLSYNLVYTLNGNVSQLVDGQINVGAQRTESGTVSSGATVSGTDSFVFSTGQFISGWSVALTLSENGVSGDQISVHIPSSSIDLAFTQSVSATPEPASLLLIGTGLAAIGAFRRRKKS